MTTGGWEFHRAQQLREEMEEARRHARGKRALALASLALMVLVPLAFVSCPARAYEPLSLDDVRKAAPQPLEATYQAVELKDVRKAAPQPRPMEAGPAELQGQKQGLEPSGMREKRKEGRSPRAAPRPRSLDGGRKSIR